VSRVRRTRNEEHQASLPTFFKEKTRAKTTRRKAGCRRAAQRVVRERACPLLLAVSTWVLVFYALTHTHPRLIHSHFFLLMAYAVVEMRSVAGQFDRVQSGPRLCVCCCTWGMAHSSSVSRQQQQAGRGRGHGWLAGIVLLLLVSIARTWMACGWQASLLWLAWPSWTSSSHSPRLCGYFFQHSPSSDLLTNQPCTHST